MKVTSLLPPSASAPLRLPVVSVLNSFGLETFCCYRFFSVKTYLISLAQCNRALNSATAIALPSKRSALQSSYQNQKAVEVALHQQHHGLQEFMEPMPKVFGALRDLLVALIWRPQLGLHLRRRVLR
jgi:hypothetical protein